MMTDASFGIIPLKKQKGQWEVLLVQHLAGHWCFPKGHALENELPIDSAKRELLEETNLKVTQLLSPIPFKESYVFLRNGQKVNKIVTYFLAEVEGHLQIQKAEINAAKWVPLKIAHSHITFPAGQSVSLEVLNFLT